MINIYNKDDYDITHPRSRVNCLILYVISIMPSFFNILLSSIIEMDLKNLVTLGPLARALYFIFDDV